MHLCIVSPHLDDAVLSCGVRMQRVRATGGRVTVINIFTAGNNAAARRAEEQAALAVLGAEAVFLDEWDAPERDPRYQDVAEIFTGDLAPVPPAFIVHIAERLRGLFADADEVLLPLAAGFHIDHCIAHAAGRHLAVALPQLPQSYYEDRPYSLWSGMLQARMNMIGCRTDLPVITPEEMTARKVDFHFVSGGGKFPSRVNAANLLPPASFALHGEARDLVASDAEIAKVYDSLAHYTSQMPYIYPDRATFLQENLAHESARSGRAVYAERSWRLSPAA